MADLERTYQSVRNAYIRIFDKIGLKYVIKSADTGEMGGSGSEEFLAITDLGTDRVLLCEKDKFAVDLESDVRNCKFCNSELTEKQTLEIGHIFKLGDRYTKAMKLTYTDSDGKEINVLMGCYGIGVSRLIAVIIEQQNDSKGICWNENVAAFKDAVIAAISDNKVLEKAQSVYIELSKNKSNVLFDDREDVSAGVKFSEADLIGTQRKIIIGSNFLKNDKIEIEYRNGRKDL